MEVNEFKMMLFKNNIYLLCYQCNDKMTYITCFTNSLFFLLLRNVKRKKDYGKSLKWPTAPFGLETFGLSLHKTYQR